MSSGLVRSVGAFGVAAWIACNASPLAAQDATTKIDISKNRIGAPPAGFEFQRTGDGELGQWTVVRDPTAVEGIAIEHVTADQSEDRFSLAIYKPLSMENVAVTARIKIISGPLLTAGLALGLRNSDSYYVVSVNAFEQRVDLLLFMNGKAERLKSYADVSIEPNHWYVVGVVLNDDHFSVSLDRKVIFTTFERTRMKDGRVALWVREDTAARFDQIEIKPLPNTEWR